jgi:hypothetical protein
MPLQCLASLNARRYLRDEDETYERYICIAAVAQELVYLYASVSYFNLNIHTRSYACDLRLCPYQPLRNTLYRH